MNRVARQSINLYLKCLLEDLSSRLICKALNENFSSRKLDFIISNPSTEFNTVNFWCWYRFGAMWSDLNLKDRQRCIVDFAKMNGVDTGDYFALPSDTSIYDGIRAYEKSRLYRVFSEPELLNDDKFVGDPRRYDSLAARRVLLFLNLVQIEEFLPPRITPIWIHYARMESFVIGGKNV